MDYKEKYEMALEGIQEILSSGEDSIKMSRLQLRLQGIFPELRKSEDEKIRESLIALVKQSSEVLSKQNQESMIAWLEKQELTQSVTKTSEQVPSLLDLKLMDCPLSVRTLNALRLWDKPTKDLTLKDLVGCTKKELLGARNFGNTTLKDVEDFLTRYGLKLKGE